MQKFKDASGREWIIDLNIRSAREIRRKMAADAETFDGVDFLDYATLLFSLNDPFFGADLIALVCADQASELGITPDAFGKLLRGKVLYDALEAFTAEYLDFFPDPTASAKMAEVVAKNKEARETLYEAIASEASKRIDEVVASVVTSSGERSLDTSDTPEGTSTESPS